MISPNTCNGDIYHLTFLGEMLGQRRSSKLSNSTNLFDISKSPLLTKTCLSTPLDGDLISSPLWARKRHAHTCLQFIFTMPRF